MLPQGVWVQEDATPELLLLPTLLALLGGTMLPVETTAGAATGVPTPPPHAVRCVKKLSSAVVPAGMRKYIWSPVGDSCRSQLGWDLRQQREPERHVKTQGAGWGRGFK